MSYLGIIWGIRIASAAGWSTVAPMIFQPPLIVTSNEKSFWAIELTRIHAPPLHQICREAARWVPPRTACPQSNSSHVMSIHVTRIYHFCICCSIIYHLCICCAIIRITMCHIDFFCPFIKYNSRLLIYSPRIARSIQLELIY